MNIPWRELATKNVKVIVKDIVIQLSFTERGILSTPASINQLDEEDQEVFEESLEKSISKSMESSVLYSEDSDEDGEEDDLGIGSVEGLFENIFSGMNIRLEGVTVLIDNAKGHTIRVKLD